MNEEEKQKDYKNVKASEIKAENIVRGVAILYTLHCRLYSGAALMNKEKRIHCFVN